MNEPNEKSPGRKPRILIVDDVRENRVLLEVMLQSVHCELLMAQDGVTALAMAAHEPLDLILCDVMMPGLTGYEVVARLRANPATRDIPVIICSSLDDSNSRSHAMSVGADDVLVKPLRGEDILRLVKLRLGHGRGAEDVQTY